MSTIVMGILNLTPDSFSDGGRYVDVQAAVERAHQMLQEGADIIDVGAESTRPGAQEVPEDEEWRRLAPVLAELCNSGAPVSVDTYKAGVAARALALGVRMINDVWGGRPFGADSDDMLRTVADAGCEYLWMHNRVSPAAERPVEALLEETRAGVERCLAAGIRPDKLWIDPGIGFGKTYEHNLLALQRLGDYTALGHRVMLGTSRKSFIGYALGTAVDDRLEGSLATVALGVWNGVAGVRVHDVRASVRTCRMVEAIRDAKA